MTRSLPEHLQLLIAGYVLGDLEPEEAAELAQLLADDPAIETAIAAEIASMQQALEITHNPPEIAPPAPLRVAILDATLAAPEKFQSTQSDHSPARSNVSRRQLPWGKVLGSAAAVLLVALGISNYSLRQRLQSLESQSPPTELRTYALQPTQATDRASATIVVNPATLEAELTVQNLPPLPPGKVYALWTVVTPNAPFTTDSKKAILTEVFTVDAQGNAAQTITVPPVHQSQEFVAAVAVTVEDAASPQQHTGSPILIAGL